MNAKNTSSKLGLNGRRTKKGPRPVILASCIAILMGVSLLASNESILQTTLSSLKRNLEGDKTFAIVTLVPGTDSDVFEFCLALKSLDENLPDARSDYFRDAPVIAFHEGNLSDKQILVITGCTDRRISFPKANFNFPPGFDPIEESKRTIWVVSSEHVVRPVNMGTRLGREKWGYTHMINFWTTEIWSHPAVRSVDVLLRIDTDSCFTNTDLAITPDWTEPIFLQIDSPQVYQSVYNPGAHKYAEDYVEGLFDFASDYMAKEGIVPSYPDLWENIRDIWENTGELITFKTNIQITHRSFFVRKDVAKWLNALSRNGGLFRHRWGDSEIQPITIAMFATQEQVRLIGDITGYEHKRGFCKDYYEIEGEHTIANLEKFLKLNNAQ